MGASTRASRIDWSHARVGGLIIVALALLAYGIYQVGALVDIFADRYTLYTPVAYTGGLIEGAQVTVGGQRVGQVDRIEFIPIEQQSEGQHLLISLAVDANAQEHIRQDSRARIRTLGLMGEKYVDIAPGTLPWPRLEEGDTLPSEPTVDTDRLLATAYDALVEAQAVLEDLAVATTAIRTGEGTLGRLLLDETLYDRAVGAADEATTLLRTINRSDGTLARLIRDPEAYERLVGALARVDTLSAEILRGQGTLARLIGSDTLYRELLGTVGDARATVARADTAILGLGGFLRRLTGEPGEDDGARAAGGTLQRLMTDPQLYDEFLRAVIELQTLILEIRMNPRLFRPEINVDVF